MVIQSYYDLCKEIDILETRLNDLEREYTFLFKRGWTNGCKKPIMRMNMIVDRLDVLIEETKKYTQLLEWKYETKREMEQKLSEIEGLDYKVVYMRDIQGKSLIEISVDLGYSYDWIRKISSKNPKKAQRRHFKIAK